MQTTLDGYLHVEWQDFRKPQRLKKPLPPPAERVYTEAELKTLFMCVHAGVCLECMETRPTSCSNHKCLTHASHMRWCEPPLHGKISDHVLAAPMRPASFVG